MVADTNFTPSSEPTPEEIVSRRVAMADHDIDFQNRVISGLREQVTAERSSLRRAFAASVFAAVASGIAGYVSYDLWTIPVSERPSVVNDVRMSAHRTCVEKVAAGHISNTDPEIATCKKIFYAEEMKDAIKKHNIGDVLAFTLVWASLGFAFNRARKGYEAMTRGNVAAREIEIAEEKRLCASASRQTADAILAELNV